MGRQKLPAAMPPCHQSQICLRVIRSLRAIISSASSCIYLKLSIVMSEKKKPKKYLPALVSQPHIFRLLSEICWCYTIHFQENIVCESLIFQLSKEKKRKSGVDQILINCTILLNSMACIMSGTDHTEGHVYSGLLASEAALVCTSHNSSDITGQPGV